MAPTDRPSTWSCHLAAPSLFLPSVGSLMPLRHSGLLTLPQQPEGTLTTEPIVSPQVKPHSNDFRCS